MTHCRLISMLFAALVLLLGGCGPGQLLGPTVTPTPSPTATQTNTPVPTDTPTPAKALARPGQWKNEIGSIMFEVTSGGYIYNFKLMNINISFDYSRKCDLTFPPMQLSPDTGSFEYIGDPAANLNGVFDSETTATGHYYIISCGGGLSVEMPAAGDWSATWIEP